MADSKMLPLGPNFNFNYTISQFVQMYQSKGFQVTSHTDAMGQAVVTISKDIDSIKKYVGLALGVTANFSVNNNTLIINYTDEEWTGKIVGFIIGWFLCWIPCATSIYGAVKQFDLPKQIGSDVTSLMGSSGYSSQQYPGAPPPPQY